MKSPENTCHIYLSASAVVIHYEEALYQVYMHLLPLPAIFLHFGSMETTHGTCLNILFGLLHVKIDVYFYKTKARIGHASDTPMKDSN